MLTLNTPQFSKFSGSIFHLWGRDENFFEWSPADIVFSTYAVDWRPSSQLRINGQYQLQGYQRRSDGTTVAVRRIASGPRRVPGDAVDLPAGRSASTTPAGRTTFATIRARICRSSSAIPGPARTSARWRSSGTVFASTALFSYQPTPGTVFFAGYGSVLTEPRGLRFNQLQRTNDGFFVKISYLFRV